MAGGIGRSHERQAKLRDTFARHGQANQATPVGRHKIHRIRCCHLRGDHQIAFVLAIFVIDKDKHPTVAGLINDLFNARNGIFEFPFYWACGFEFGRHSTSRSC